MGVVGQNNENYIPELSPRQREVAELIGFGLSNQKIAEQLDIEKRTVERHMGAIVRKLDLDTISDKVSPRVMIARYILLGERIHPFDHNKRITVQEIKRTFKVVKIEEELRMV